MKDFKEEIAKPRKIALYANMEGGYCLVDEVRFVRHDEHFRPLPNGQQRERVMDGYVRITEPVEINLAAIGNDEIVAKAVESLTETERKIMVEMEEKLMKIREQKKQLLALTYQPAGDSEALQTPKDVSHE